MDTSLGVGITLHAYSLSGTFTSSRIGLCALTAHGKTAHVTDAAITLDALQALEVDTDLAAKVALNYVFALLNCVDYLRKLLLGEILCANGRIDVCTSQNLDRIGRAYAVNVAQRNVDALVRRNFYSNDACYNYP